MYEFAYGATSEKRLFEKSSPVSAAAGAAKMTVSATRTVRELMLEVIANVGSGCQSDLGGKKVLSILRTYKGQLLSRIGGGTAGIHP